MSTQRFDVIQLVIVIVGIACLYHGVILLPDLFVFIYYWVDGGMRASGSLSNIVVYFITFAFYFLAGMMIIRRSASYSEYVVNRSNINNDFKFSQTKSFLLYILFLGIGCYNLLEKVPPLLKNIYMAFAEKVSRRELNNELHTAYAQNPTFAVPIINLILTILLLAFAKDLGIYFGGKISTMDEIANPEENDL